ncbi:putative galactosyltransferase sqv-3 [Trichinella murrelli]|uniref:Putative galactosyltransferase sqv-3 n=1 Tax=Trichinella murrelli TaxID=144512 RepID=A0A0V0TCD4_9BILA|nr:putative galactosyltransferase sqv-3 [Trichinella murrelli]
MRNIYILKICFLIILAVILYVQLYMKSNVNLLEPVDLLIREQASSFSKSQLHKLCVVVPFRDRFYELQKFVPHIHQFLHMQRIFDFSIIVINQQDSYRFNRAALINIGYFESVNESCDYFAMHDVDLLPLNKHLNYGYPVDGVYHVASPEYHPLYHYEKYIGGILILKLDDFKQLNGMSNKYWGWGLEDDEFYLRVVKSRLRIHRPKNLLTDSNTTFHHLHDELVRQRDFTKKHRRIKELYKRDQMSGLSNVNYSILHRTEMAIEGKNFFVLSFEIIGKMNGMKRYYQDESLHYSRKRRRSGHEGPELRLLIASKSAGAVIGKGGENIKRLRSQYCASVNIPDSSTPERVLNISCANVATLTDCVSDLIPRLDDGKSGPQEAEVRMLVHQSQAGAIIGRAGFKIKELRDITGAGIRVYSECAPLSTERVIQFSGDKEKIVNAIRHVKEICEETPIKGVERLYDANNYDMSYALDYGGYTTDRNWRSNSTTRRSSGIHSSSPAASTPHFTGVNEISPMQALGYSPMSLYAENLIATVQVTIPKELGGTIIGKGGERINRIREESGAQIVVDPPTPDSDERIITISGTTSQIKLGQYLLQQCIPCPETHYTDMSGGVEQTASVETLVENQSPTPSCLPDCYFFAVSRIQKSLRKDCDPPIDLGMDHCQPSRHSGLKSSVFFYSSSPFYGYMRPNH